MTHDGLPIGPTFVCLRLVCARIEFNSDAEALWIEMANDPDMPQRKEERLKRAEKYRKQGLEAFDMLDIYAKGIRGVKL